jgi:hypothetical protein
MKTKPIRIDCHERRSPFPIGENKAKEMTAYKATIGGANNKERTRALRNEREGGGDGSAMQSAHQRILRPSSFRLKNHSPFGI